jgi:hypothetical protein
MARARLTPQAGVRVLWSLLLGGGLALPTGCGPATNLQLVQPQLAGRQQSVQLHSDRAFWSPGGPVDRALIEFPLPGASTGRPTFLLYLRLPVGTADPWVCTATAPADPASGHGAASKPDAGPATRRPSNAHAGPMARGFFIQTRGDFAGLALITGGTIRINGRSNAPQATRELQIELTCEDGSRITGRAVARRDDWYVKKFETREHPADVRIVTEH